MTKYIQQLTKFGMKIKHIKYKNRFLNKCVKYYNRTSQKEEKYSVVVADQDSALGTMFHLLCTRLSSCCVISSNTTAMLQRAGDEMNLSPKFT